MHFKTLEKESCRYNPCPDRRPCQHHNDGEHQCLCPSGDVNTCSNVEILNADFGLEYLIVRKEVKAWLDAKESCEALGYNLTSVLSEDEASFLVQYM